MFRFLWVLVLVMVGCASEPSHIVLPANEPEIEKLFDVVSEQMAGLEERAGCRLVLGMSIDGGSRIWRGELPPNGVTTIQIVEDDDPRLNGSEAHASWGVTKSRCRIYAKRSALDGHSLFAHEYGHCLGFSGHTKSGVMAEKSDGLDLGKAEDFFKKKCIPEEEGQVEQQKKLARILTGLGGMQ